MTDELVRVLLGGLLSGGLLTGAAALLMVRVNRRAGVSGDEREARRDELTQRRDTIADRDSQIDQLQEDVAGLRGEVGRLTELVQRQSEDLERERAWNRALVDQIYRGEGPPPRPRPAL